MIEIHQLTKRFARATAVQQATFSAPAGQAVALWGANGAGKTTIIRCILGLLSYEGSIRVGGFDAARRGKQARRLIGYVPQELGFHDDQPVAEAVRFFARLKGVSIGNVDEELARVGLAGCGGKRIRTLSGGMKQRLALSLALQGDPPALVLDEVTASLDAHGREDFIGVLSHLARDGRRAVLFASHRLEEIRALATRVIVLDRGRLVADLPAAEFLRQRAETSSLHIFLSESVRGRAVLELRSRGFLAGVNGRGIYVAVAPGRRAEPLAILSAARLHVEDFEMLDGFDSAEFVKEQP